MNSLSHTLPEQHTNRGRTALRLAACSSILMVGLVGCKAKPADDAALTRNVQSSLSNDGSLSGLGIQGTVQGGVATLTGNAQNDAQRSLAARDASGIDGVRQVVNNISIESAPIFPASTTQAIGPPPAPEPVPIRNTSGRIRPDQDRRDQDRRDQERRDQERAQQQQAEHDRQERARNHQAPIERDQPNGNQQASSNQPNYNPPPPPAPPKPVYQDVTVPSGYAIAVRMTQALDSADAQQGQTFSGVVANDVMADGIVAIPAGTRVSGQVSQVQEAGHFEGHSLLSVSLTSVDSRGERLPIATEPYTVQGKGRGKNTLEKTGGGAAVGAILGGIFGGGKGAAIGAAAGGGVGAGSNAITRGEQIQIPSESIVRFRIARPIPLHVRTDGGQNNLPVNSDPTLQHHPN